MMKKIRIFVASSIVSFNSERKRLGAFFCEWNNCLINKSIFLDVKFCEELDNAVPEKRKQDEYNSYIEKSDLFIMLTDSECGNYTLEEFEVAYNSKRHPKLMVFCRESLVPFSDNVNQIKSSTEGKGEFIFYSNYKNQVELYISSYIQNIIDEWTTNNILLEKSYRKIIFFFGTCDMSYEDERNEILRFILGLNERMLDKGIYIQAEPDNIIYNSSQDGLLARHRGLINESEIAFFLFFSKVDELLEADFHYALEQFQNKSYPKIFTYFFNQVSANDEGILRLKKYIDCEINHYYSEFSSVDSIKLSILIQLSDRYIPDFRISINDGIINDESLKQDILDVNCLSIFSENDTLIKLRCELEVLMQQYDEMVTEFSNDHKRRDLITKISDINDAICAMNNKIHKEENAALIMLIEMHRNVAKGEMNQLVKTAYRYLEAGRVKEASKILNKDIVDAMYGQYLNTQIIHMQEEIIEAIQMYKHTIHIQKMLEETEDTINTIISCYEEVLRYLEFLNSAEIDIVLDYAEYLDGLGRKEAEKVFRKAEYLASNPERTIMATTWARLYALIGSYYVKQYDSEMAETYLKLNLDIMEELYNSDNMVFAVEYAEALLRYCHIGGEKKVKFMECGLSALLTVCRNNMESVEYNLALAKYYWKYGTFCGNYDREKALELYMNAKEILEKYSISDQLLADVYNCIAELIKESDANCISEATVSRYHDLAIYILEKNYSIEPDKYAESLGVVYNNKAVFYTHYSENYYQALQYLKASEKVYLYLYKKKPIQWGVDLAECYIQMANQYESLGNSKKAIAFSEKGIDLLEELAEINRERYAIKLAWAYKETGLMYLLLNQKKKVSGTEIAIEYFSKCLAILENTNNEYIQSRQPNFIIEMLIGLYPNIKEKKEITEDIYSIMDRIFRYFYKICFILETEAKCVDTMFNLGYMLLNYFDKKNNEETKEFYYPAMKEIAKMRLANVNLSEEEKMFTNFYLAGIVGIMGDEEGSQEYFNQSIFSFLKSDAATENIHSEITPSKKSFKKSTKKKRKKR